MVTAEELVKLQGPVVADAAELAALRALAALLADDAARPCSSSCGTWSTSSCTGAPSGSRRSGQR
jgi:hypothetical protein